MSKRGSQPIMLQGRVTWKVRGDNQPVLTFITQPSDGDPVIGFLAPAQARELAHTLIEGAARVELREGLPGVARVDAFVQLPTIEQVLRSQALGE